MMATIDNQLRVEDLPYGVTSSVLKFTFQNTRKQGGGVVKEVVFTEGSSFAIIIFEEKEAVDIVLQKGESVRIKDTTCKVSRVTLKKEQVARPLFTSNNQTPTTSSWGKQRVPIQSTVQINIKDVFCERDKIELYIEDPDINSGQFYKDSIFIDGLKKAVYVTFHTPEDARKLCREECEDDPNILSIEMAPDDVHDFYTNLLSIHGFEINSIKEAELKRYIKSKTGLSLSQVITGEEPYSAILVLNGVSDIHSITWKCVGELKDGVKMFTAPVKQCAMIHASFTEGIDLFTVDRYFKNHNKSGGGPVKKSSCISEKEFIVVFKDLTDADSVLKRKDHSIGSAKIRTKLWHHCLSKEAYRAYLDLPSKEDEAFRSGRQKPSASFKRSSRSESSHGFEIPYELNYYEYILIKRSGFLPSLMQQYNVEIDTNDNTHCVTLKGSEKLAKYVKNIIAEKAVNFDKKRLGGFDKKMRQFLLESQVQKRLNDLLSVKQKIAFIFSQNEILWCWFDTEEVKNQIDEVKKIITDSYHCCHENYMDQILALTSDEGKKFIVELKERAEFPCVIDVNLEAREVEIITIEEDQGEPKNIPLLWYKINKFVKESKIESKHFQFPVLKLKFVLVYRQKELDTIRNELEASGALVELKDDGIKMTGLQLGIDKAEKRLSKIRDSITMQEQELRFFGVVEYFASEKGKNLLEETAKTYHCLIQQGEDYACTDGASGGAPQHADMGILMASCKIGEVDVNFIRGDITAMNVGVLVNPINSKLEMRSGMSKAVLQNGGDQIKHDLNGFSGKKDGGDILLTKAGNLPCSMIYHLVLQDGVAAPDLCPYVTGCLRKADGEKYESLAMPVIGCGRFKIPEFGASNNISKAITQWAKETSSLKKIILCDNNRDRLKSMMKRFQSIDDSDGFQRINDSNQDDEDSHDSSHGKGGGRPYREEKQRIGDISLTLKKGNILDEKCDVIACSIRADMDLKTGGAVSKAMLSKCGNSFQTDCFQKVTELQQEGAVEVTTNGLQTSTVIFVNIGMFSRRWDKGVHKLLSMADENGHTTLAMPAFGTGGKHADVRKLKDIILRAIKKFGKEANPKNLKEVNLVIYGDTTFNAFRSETEDAIPSRTKKHRNDSRQHSAVPISPVSQAIKFQIVHDDAANGQRAFKHLESTCQREFQKTSVVSSTKSMHQKQIKELVTQGQRMNVKVTVQKETNLITLESFNVSDIMTMQSYIHNFTLKWKDEEHKTAIRGIKTAFKWQYMTNEKLWQDFGAENNLVIEKAYKDQKSSVEIDDSKGRKYRIDFQTMEEIKIKGDGSLSKKFITVNRYDLSAVGEKLPDHWDQMDTNLKIVSLSNQSKEYQEVETYFKKCGATVVVKKIDRIQNALLYQQYASKKRYLDNNNPQGTENEKKLFHGSDAQAITNINSSGFNRSFCGKNAVAYGNGVYFATQSSYSVSYAKADASGDHVMYLARVLVGVSIASQSGMTHLPNQPGKNVPYDSGTGPNMFIIFHDSQAYPEYLITF